MTDTPTNPGTAREFAPCPTCGQYSHSIGEDRIAAAFLHFQSMFSHRGDGIPTRFCFDEKTRDAAQVLVAAARPSTGDMELRKALREHWLTGVECDHEAKTDTATCFCSVWRSEPKPSVIAAVDAWIDHLLEHAALASPPLLLRSSVERD